MSKNKATTVTYWLDVQINPFTAFHIVPNTSFSDDQSFFHERLTAVRESGFAYSITETDSEIVERNSGTR